MKPRSVPILTYHHVHPDGHPALQRASRKGLLGHMAASGFRSQLELLTGTGWQIRSTSEIIDWLIDKSQIPQKTVAIHFDNGWLDTWETASTVLDEYGARALVYIIGGTTERSSGRSGVAQRWSLRTRTEGHVSSEDHRIMSWEQVHDLLDSGWEVRSAYAYSSTADGVRVISVMDGEADFFDLFTEQREHPEVELLVRAQRDRILERKAPGKRGSGKTQKRTLFGHLRAAPVRARFRLQVPRQSRRIMASKQASRSGGPARVAPMELRYETLTIPAPQRTHAGVDPVKLSVVHAREISPPPQGKRLEWFLLTTLPVTDPEQARRLLTWYGLRWRVEDYFRVLKTGCRVQQLQHHTAERLQRAIAIHTVIAWRIMLMTLLGRQHPDLPAQLLFSDLEIRVLGAFAASRGFPPPAPLEAAVLLLSRLGGYLARKYDPPPGHQLMWQGYITLYGMCLGFALREET